MGNALYQSDILPAPPGSVVLGVYEKDSIPTLLLASVSSPFTAHILVCGNNPDVLLHNIVISLAHGYWPQVNGRAGLALHLISLHSTFDGFDLPHLVQPPMGSLEHAKTALMALVRQAAQRIQDEPAMLCEVEADGSRHLLYCQGRRPAFVLPVVAVIDDLKPLWADAQARRCLLRLLVLGSRVGVHVIAADREAALDTGSHFPLRLAQDESGFVACTHNAKIHFRSLVLGPGTAGPAGCSGPKVDAEET